MQKKSRTLSQAAGHSSLPLATTWWRQYGLADHLNSFRAGRQPTPARLPLKRRADGSPLLVWSDHSAVHMSPPTLMTTPSLPSTATAGGLRSGVPRLLVSACLLSYPVTYRGTHATLPKCLRPTPLLFLTEVLFKELGLLQCIPVCPEVQWLGLPVPRAPLRLVRGPRCAESIPRGDNCPPTAECNLSGSLPSSSRATSSGGADEKQSEVRYLVDSATEDDVLLQYETLNDNVDAVLSSPRLSTTFLPQLLQDLDTVDGIILKSYSPSCGVHDARLYEKVALPSCSSVCHQQACKACEHGGKPTPTPTRAVGKRPDVSKGPPRRFELVDGFLTHQLRAFLDSEHEVGEHQRADSHSSSSGETVPVITCDRLLTHFYAEERCLGTLCAGDVASRRVDIGAAEALPALTSLDCFIESVLQHREWRLSRGRR